jgi:vitamin B12 transport system ATP-binding protein
MTLLMQLTDVAEKGRLEPMSGHQCRRNPASCGAEWRRKEHAAGADGGADHRAREITLLGHSLAEWSPVSLAHRRSYLVQQQVPPFAMPVWHYLMLHLHDKSRTALLEEVAAALGLEDKLSRNASQLSGGEWQRVRLAAVILQIHPAGNPQGCLLFWTNR